MRRLHLFEFGDQQWFPQVLRDAETAYLGWLTAYCRWLDCGQRETLHDCGRIFVDCVHHREMLMAGGLSLMEGLYRVIDGKKGLMHAVVYASKRSYSCGTDRDPV
jgi:hypothetical protein